MNKLTELRLHQLGRDWYWPGEDQECRAVVFDWSEDLKATYDALEHIDRLNPEAPDEDKYRSCVQAGGNMGVWPWLLAQRFHNVYTFEPDPVCFHYLCKNVEAPNVHKFQAALGRRHELVQLTPMKANLGAQYIAPTLSLDVWARPIIPTLKIDDLALNDCDLIYLDVEGYEQEALYGAYNTIATSKPVIVVEDKGLSDKYGTEKGFIERWLWHEYRYEVFRRVHRDVILVPPKEPT